MFEIACNKKAILMGKPSEEYFKLGMDRTNSTPETTIIVGDDINTDISGAKKVNAIAIQVKTGVYTEEELEKAQYKPDYIIETVNSLLEMLK